MNPLIKLKIKSFENVEETSEKMSEEMSFLTECIEKKLKNKNIEIEITSEMESKILSEDEYLFFSNGKLNFHSSKVGVMAFDFGQDLRYHARQKYALSREPLAKALGLVGHPGKIIWDTTCGTGKDSLLISHFLAKLTAFERHPAVYLLLCDAKRRDPVNFEIIFGDPAHSTDFTYNDKPQVIYYDPMYPEKKKSALARKEMRIFKSVVGVDADSSDFLDWALTVATERVVVKRALHAAPIKENPSASYTGKSTRYDMYKIF